MEGGMIGIVIIVSALMIQFFVFGVSASLGVYNIEFLDDFGASAAEVSLIAALNYGVFLGSGPIVSFLMSRFSYKKIVMGGSLMVVLGLLSVVLLPYLHIMYLSLGVITGFGSCCAYIPSHTLSGLFYEKNRSLATGIATSGSGLGGAIMPVLAGWFIGIYSWKGSFIIVAGLCLHLFIFASLLRNPPAVSEEFVVEEVASHPVDDLESHASSNKLDKIVQKRKPLDLSCARIDHDFANVDMSHLDFMDKCSWRPGAGYLSIENLHHLDDNSHTSHTADLETAPEKYVEEDNLLLGEETSCISNKSERQLSVASRLEKGLIQENFTINENGHSEMSAVKEKCTTPETSRHIYVFKSYNFDIYFVNNILWNMSTAILLTFLAEYLRLHNKTAMEAAWLNGAFGFGGFLGGILGGVLGNFKAVNRINLFIYSCLALGITIFIIPLDHSLIFYVFILLTSGITFGIVLGLLIVVLTDLIGIESLGNGMGYLMLANGLGTLTGPLLAGVLIDYSGYFEISIYLSAVLALLSGVAMLPIPLRKYMCRCHEKRTSNGAK